MAMGEGKVNCLDTLLRAGLNHRLGVRGMIELLDRARKGLYKPKDFTEEEMSHGLFFLWLGGACSTVMSLSLSATFPTKSEIQCNIRATFKNLPGHSRCGYILMIDKIKEHTEHVSMEFCSMSDAKALVHGILHRKIHHATEATVFSIGILLEDRHVWGLRPFIIGRTCKQEGTDRHVELISTVIAACNAEVSMIGCPLFTIASDRESHRGSALTVLTHLQPLDPDSELLSLLRNLCLMNILVSDNNITADKDQKHVMKHCRNFTIHNFIITPVLVCFHLQVNNIPSHQIAYLLNPTDRQDVLLCYTLMKEIWSLPPSVPTDNPGFVAARGVLVTLSLQEQLVHLSAAAHLATYLFTANGTRCKAMPSPTFKDLILLVKNTFFCVAKTDRLESTFSIVQLMVKNDANTNVLTLGHHLSHAVECLNILAEHPVWDHSPRCLHLCGIKDRNGNVLSKSDHLTPESWVGNVNVQNISLLVVSEFPASNIEDTLLELESKGFDMEFPKLLRALTNPMMMRRVIVFLLCQTALVHKMQPL
ncbi:hypothetical protein V8E53_010019 [Lactarius tabidus]